MAVPVSPARLGAELSPAAGAPPPAPAPPPADAAPPPTVPPLVVAAYPLLLAVVPPLSLAARTAGAYAVGDLVAIVATILVATGALLALLTAAALPLGRRDALARGAFATLLVVAWVFYYLPLQEGVAAVARPLARSAILAPLCLLATLALAALALRRPAAVRGAARFLALAGALLVVSSVGRTALAHVRAAERAERSATWRALSAPVPANPALARSGPPRDVYLLVLDGYPNAEVFRTTFGFDNGKFVDSLRALGFTIPRRVRSNYTATVLSVGSMLNFAHVNSLGRELAPNDADHTIIRTLIQRNRAARFLRERGYQYLLYPPEWFEGTRRSPLADHVYAGPNAFSLPAELQGSELRRVVVNGTLLSKFPALRQSYGGVYMLDQFRAVREVPAREAPTFTFAHFLIPHQPIVLDGACRPRNSAGDYVGERMGLPGDRDTFFGAVRCANAQVLGVVTELLRRSSPAPIIAIVGDHGTLSRGWAIDAKLPVDSIAAERLGAFGAFYMPDGGAAMFADSVTHVNVFRNVLRYYFGADLPPESNEGYFTQATEAYLFRPVDERAVIGGG